VIWTPARRSTRTNTASQHRAAGPLLFGGERNSRFSSTSLRRPGVLGRGFEELLFGCGIESVASRVCNTQTVMGATLLKGLSGRAELTVNPL
jgi:hypothetical protein